MLVRPYTTFEVSLRKTQFQILKYHFSFHKTDDSNCIFDCIFDTNTDCDLSFKVKVFSTSYTNPVCQHKWMDKDEKFRTEFFQKNQYQKEY